MTDNGLAALGTALDDHNGGSDYHCNIRCAAAILAALPPDWCGHDPTLYIQVADLTERLEAAESQADRQAAEIARLRKIEEAARAVLETAQRVPWPEFWALHDALDGSER